MKAPPSYYITRYIAVWADLIDALIAIVSFTAISTNLGLYARCNYKPRNNPANKYTKADIKPKEVKVKHNKEGKTCKCCGHLIYWIKYRGYRCLCDKAET